ncbi:MULTISPECIES: CvfB family protein [unclassified Colwellia]|uniref:CvfB family protein n=1 Tax=unclassified Colwellia TaxID=196834 RepID=UPI0015F3E60D|nr:MULTISPECIES: S1-like domain-containing RNA-binding protein [unclassified Colwellia]MBA6232079.1 GntR family transcriptional regulator [Colwellia sp. MB02u-7]MBA6237223.1 GntR family transcriptional regulator [Colwellia sp. MB02u-11]MBA6254689.1 GntR family transcriptional regulator [Colwellia sp. MB3u-28]MBA6260417.1 GntR family transcriptional regulator [Colwellia sp. MB3u-41]MBA6300210.1 GntR family transcriptional regulator [Colwellia sp. MB3u-22]
MADIGKYNTLSVVAVTDKGAYLGGGELGEVLLPNRFVPENCKVEDKITVFIYLDSAERIVATTDKPLGQVDEFVSLKVKQLNKMGAFLDWGLPKDLLVPFNQQHTAMEEGKYYLVRIFLDTTTDRIAASSKLDKYIDIWPADYQKWDKVKLMIGGKTDLGFKAIINDKHWGLLYDNEIFQPLRVGKIIDGYIKNIREDGRIDLSLSRSGEGKVNDFADKLLAHIAENDGFSPLHDKSSPELIQRILGVSKKTFKATVGNLLKKDKITIEKSGLRLK